jgi:zinc-binding in reverse transcriptase
MFGGVKTILPKSVWVLKIPIKNKLFLWMTLHNQILTKDNLRKQGWSGDQNCVFCTSPESVDHLFFHCPFVVDFWSKLLASHPQRRHICLSSLLDFWHSCFLFSDFQVWGKLLAASIWVVWLERNKIFTPSLAFRPANVSFPILSLYKFWTGSYSGLEHLGIAVGAALQPIGAASVASGRLVQKIGAVSLSIGPVAFSPVQPVQGILPASNTPPSDLADDEDLLD